MDTALVGNINGNCRHVSGEGGSCFYRALAYRDMELRDRVPAAWTPDVDRDNVHNMRTNVDQWLHSHAHERSSLPNGPTWAELCVGVNGDRISALNGFAEAPIPQIAAEVIGRPVHIRFANQVVQYGDHLPGEPAVMCLDNQHYGIVYPNRVALRI